MSVIDYNNILLEILNELRSADVLSTTERGVTTNTDSFTAAGGAETFTLTETSGKNVRSVTQNSTTLSFGTDYTFTYGASGNITEVVISKVLTVGDDIDINYDYGTGDAVYADYPRQDIKISNYPRLGFNFVTMPTEIIAVNSVESFSPRIQFSIYDTSIENVQDKMGTLRQWVKDNQQSLYYSNILHTVDGTAYDLVREQGQSKIYKMDLDVMNILNIER